MASTLTSEATGSTVTTTETEPASAYESPAIVIVNNFGMHPFTEDVLGLYAAKVACTLRDNLINLFGYLMYQQQRKIGAKLHYCFNELKQGLQVNAIDVFELIPSIPTMAAQEPNQQLLTLLLALEKITPKSFCMIKCSVRDWRKKVEAAEMNLTDFVWHFGYDAILEGIVQPDDREELQRIRGISKIIGRPLEAVNEKQAAIIEVFGPSFLKIVLEIKTKRFCLSEMLIGYLIAFYPWPLNSQNIDVALSNLKHYFTDEDVDLLRCEINTIELEKIIDEPINMLTKLLHDIENSWCDSNIRIAAAIVGRALKYKSTNANYANVFRRNMLIEPNAVFDLLNIINSEKYPLEIVLARNRVYKYLQKLIYHINRHKFVPYNYDTLEEALCGLLNFVLNSQPHTPMPIKQSIKAIRAYLTFYIKPVTISYSLLHTVIDGFLAPDLRDDIIAEMIEVKKMALDETKVITLILQTRPKEKCIELMSCYLKITSILKNDERFGLEKSEYMVLPSALFYRFVQSQVKTKPDGVHVDITSLLDILNYNDYPRDTVLAANKLRDYIRAGAHMMPEFLARIYCTKQEVLLAYLKELTKLGSLSTEVDSNLQSMISPIVFMTSYKKSIDLKVFSTVLDTWRTTETDDFLVEQVTKIDEYISENDKEVEMALSSMDVSLCLNILDCYNNIANHLNEQGSAYTFITFRISSPKLSSLNLGKLKPMTTQLLLKIVKSVATFENTNNELEAAISYAREFSDELDKHLVHMNCNNLHVINCFQRILDKLKFTKTKLQVNILQFLLMPTTCDNTHCRWIPYDEKGSTILNPVLGYMAYLLEKYKSSLKSMHLRMDLDEIVDYLHRDNINYILENFEITSIHQPVERISTFIKMLSESNLIEVDVQESIRNVRQYMYTNKLPKKLTVGNLLGLHDVFSELTINENVLCHMHQAASYINRKKGVISEVLNQIEVDCFTLEKCINSFEILKEHAHSEQAGTPLIMELINPDVCTQQICPWLRVSAKAEYVTVKKRIITEMEVIGLNKSSPLIVQALMDYIKYVARSPNILDNLEKIGKKIITTKDGKLQTYLAWLVNRPETPKRKAVYYRAIERYLRTGHVPTVINNFGMIFVMRALKAETYDIMVCQDIDALLHQLSEMELYTEKWLSKFRVRCNNLDECSQSIYNNIQKLGIASEGIPLHIIRILRAVHCSKVDCPHKIEITKDELDSFMEDSLAQLEKLKSDVSCPFHIQMNIDSLIRSIAGNFISKIIEKVMYDSSKDRYLNLLKYTIADSDSTKELKRMAENVYNYKIHGNYPSYLHFPDLMLITEQLKQMTANDDVILQIDEIAEKLLNNRDNVNDLLEKLPVDCQTLQSCLHTLMVRLMKRSDSSISQDIMNLIEPESCTADDCPWTKDSPTKEVGNKRHEIARQLKRMLSRKNLSLHVRMNLEELNKFLHDDDTSLEYNPMRRKGHQKMNDTLLMHLRNLGKQILVEKDLELVKQNVEDFLAHNILPEVMDVKSFTAFAKVLIATVKDPSVVDEMNTALAKIESQKHAVNEFMKDCSINCFDAKSCVETVLQCTRSDVPESIQVRNMLIPSSCNQKDCEWMTSESRQRLLMILEEVKHDLRVLAKKVKTPLIISIEATDLISYMKLKNVEAEASKLSGARKKGRVMCRYLGSKKNNLIVKRRATNVYVYYASARVPNMAFMDLAGLARVMARNTKDVDIQDGLTSILEKQAVHRKETQAAFKSCQIKCVKLEPCLRDIKTCFEKSKSQIVRDFLSFLAPPGCTPEACPWIPEGLETIPPAIYPLETIQPTLFVIFYQNPYDDEIVNHIEIDLTDAEVVKEVERYTGMIQETRMRITSVTVGTRVLNFYFNKIEIYKKLGRQTEQVAIDLSKYSEFVLCVPFPSEDTRPLKFNIMKAGARESLTAIGKKQGPASAKPKVTLSDYDGTKYDLIIDVMNQNSLREMMQQTIDDISPARYWPIAFWPGSSEQRTWRSVVVTENDQVLRYLTDLPGIDDANKMTPIVVSRDGIASMDYDPLDRKFRREMDSMFSEVPTLEREQHHQYTFYVTHPSERCCIPVYIDLSESSVIQGLQAFNGKFPLEGDEPTFFVTPSEDKTSTFPVYIDFFDKDMVNYLLALKCEITNETDTTEIEDEETPTTTHENIDEPTVSPTPPKIILDTVTPSPHTFPPSVVVHQTTTENPDTDETSSDDEYVIISEMTAGDEGGGDEHTDKISTEVPQVGTDETELPILTESILTTVAYPDTFTELESTTVSQHPNVSMELHSTTEVDVVIIPELTSNTPQENASSSAQHPQFTSKEVFTQASTMLVSTTTERPASLISTHISEIEKSTTAEITTESSAATSSSQTESTTVISTAFTTFVTSETTPTSEISSSILLSTESVETINTSIATAESVITQTDTTAGGTTSAFEVTENSIESTTTTNSDSTTDTEEVNSSNTPDVTTNTEITSSISTFLTFAGTESTETVQTQTPTIEGNSIITAEVTTNMPDSKPSETYQSTTEEIVIIPELTSNTPATKAPGTRKPTTAEEIVVTSEVTSNIPASETPRTTKPTTEEILVTPEVTSNIPAPETPGTSERTTEEEFVVTPEVTTNIPTLETPGTSEATTEEEITIIPEVSTDILETQKSTTDEEFEVSTDILESQKSTTDEELTLPEVSTDIIKSTTEDITEAPEVTTNISIPTDSEMDDDEETIAQSTETITSKTTTAEAKETGLTQKTFSKEIEEATEELITEVPIIDFKEVCHLVLIPIANKTDIVVLDVGNPAVINTLSSLSGKINYNGPSMIFNVLDFNDNVMPIELNPDDAIVIRILKALVENTAVSFKPRSVETTDDEDIIIVSQHDDFGTVKQLVFENNDSNKKLVQPYRASIGQRVETIPFSSGGVKVTVPPGLTPLIGKLRPPRLTAVNYAKCQHNHRNIKEFVLPVYKEGKCYYYYFDNRKADTIEKLRKISSNTTTGGVTITVVTTENQQVHITLDLTQEDAMIVLDELCIRKELQGDANGAIMAIVAANKASSSVSFLLDLSNDKVLRELTANSKNINPSSTTKAVVYYRHRSGKLITIVVDYNAYNFGQLKRLERFTSVDLKPVLLPNSEGKIPYLSFMILDSNQVKRSVVLNLGDEEVLKRLRRLSRSASYNLPINVRLSDNKLYKFYINKTDPRTVAALIELTNQCPVTGVPTKTIARDGSYKVVVPLRGITKVTFVELNTKDKGVMKTLKDLESDVPFTVPSMMVLNHYNTGEEIRIDINNQDKFDILLGHARNFRVQIMPQTMIVIWLPDKGFVMVDCSKEVVVEELEKISLRIYKNIIHDHIVFQDANRMIVSVRLSLKDQKVIDKLVSLAEMTSENRNPITIMVRPRKKIVIFTILNAAKKVKPVILDLTSRRVINELIAVSNPYNGITIDLVDTRKNPLVVRLDVSDSKVVWKLLELTKLTKSLPPFVYPPYAENFPEIRIPLKDKATNTSVMQVCNMTDGIIVERFLKIPGKNIKGSSPGTAFPIINTDNENAIAFLDLSNNLVVKKLREVCPNQVTVVNPGKILLLVLKNKYGKYNYVFLNTNNGTVLEELKKISEEAYDAPDLQTYQIIDPNGNVCTIKLNLQDNGVQVKLKELSKLSSNSASFVISKEDKQHLVVIIANYDSPIIIPVDQVKEVEQEIDQIKLLVEEGKFAEASEVQQKLPANFIKVNLIPGSSFGEGKVQIACLNVKGQNIRLTINLRKKNMTEAIVQAATISEKSKAALTIRLMDHGKISTYNLDNTNPKVCNLLKTYCDDYFFCPKDNSLLILMLARRKMIMLDLTNEKVLDELRSMAKTTKVSDATHVGIHMAGGYVVPFKLNLDDEKVSKKLLNLASLTPAPTIPTSAVNPSGLTPFVVFTLKSGKDANEHFVLDVGSKMVRTALSRMSTFNPKRPYMISCKQANGKHLTWLLDLNSTTVMALKNLTNLPSMPKDAILNVPKKNAVTADKAVIPTEDAKGNVLYRMLDLTDVKVKIKLNALNRHMTGSTPAMVVYSKDSNQNTKVWRINIKRFEEYINKNSSRIQKAYLHPTAVLVVTFMDSVGELKAVILDVFMEKVDSVLKTLSDATPLNSSYSMVILDTFTDVKAMFRLDLTNETVQKALLELQETTPKPLIPIKISNPTRSTHFVVMTIAGADKKTTPIILDLNNQQVVDELDQISKPGDKNAFSIDVSNNRMKKRNVHVNVFRKSTCLKLERISRLCPLFKAPITLQKHEIKVLPINDEDGQTMLVKINTTDPNIINKLMKLSYDTPEDKADLWFNILDVGGNVVTIKLNRRDHVTMNKLTKMYRKVIEHEGILVTPPTGTQPLMTISVRQTDCYAYYTLDPNLHSVISILKRISSDSHKGESAQQFKVVDKDMKEFIVYIDSTKPDVVRSLYEASQFSDIQISPPLITPSTGAKPLLHFVARTSKYNMLSFTVDLNNATVVKALHEVSLPTPAAAYAFSQDIFLNISDPRTLGALEKITTESDIKLMPISQDIPTVQLAYNIRLNLCNAKVVEELIGLDDKDAKKDNLVKIAVRNRNGLQLTVSINLKDERVQAKLKQISLYTPIPTVSIKTTRWTKQVQVLPISLSHENSMPPILLGLHPTLGKITIDLSDNTVLEQLSSIKLNSNIRRSFIEVAGAGGDIKRINFDAENKETLKVVKHLNSMSNVSFDVSAGCWFPTVTFKKKNGGRLVLDLANRTVLKILENSTASADSNPYILQVPAAQGYKQIRVDPEDPEIERRLLDGAASDDQLEDEKKVSWVTFELKSNTEIHTYTVDINNSEMMKKLRRYSTNRRSNVHTKPVTIPKINKKFYFDSSCATCKKLLEELTMRTTGAPSEIKPLRARSYYKLRFYDKYGKTTQVALDLANEEVMDDLRYVSDNYHAGLKEMRTTIEMPDGTAQEFAFDVGDVKTIDNLRCLEKHSLRIGACRIDRVNENDDVEDKALQFAVDSPELGPFNITVNPNNPTVLKKFLNVNKMVKKKRKKDAVTFKNPIDDKMYMIYLDTNDPQVLYNLLVLSKMSTGSYPLKHSDQQLRELLKLPVYVTIEVYNKYEMFSLTVNKHEWRTKSVRSINIQANKPGMITVFKTETNETLKLDLQDEGVIETLLTISIPTVFIKEADKVDLYTVFIVKQKDTVSMILLNLAEKETALAFLMIIEKYGDNRPTTCVQIRDSNGQYVPIEINMENSKFLADLSTLSPYTKQVVIDARLRPYLVICTPIEQYSVRIKLTTRNIKHMVKLNGRSKLLTATFRASNQRLYHVNVDFYSRRLLKKLSKLRDSAWINARNPDNVFVAYVREGEGANGIYLDTDNANVIQTLKSMQEEYNSNDHLTVIKCWSNRKSVNYFTVNLNNQIAFEKLKDVSLYVAGHDLVMTKTKLKHGKHRRSKYVAPERCQGISLSSSILRTLFYRYGCVLNRRFMY